MSKIKLPATLTRKFHKVGFALKKHSPEIMIVVGTIGVVTSAVMACRSTLKVHEVIDSAKSDIDDIHEATEHGYTKAGEKYSAEDSKKDLTIVYAQTGLKLVKLYGPAVVLGTASLGAMIASNGILRKRNVALAAAYATVDRSFKDYRGRVIERFGEELDKELKYNLKAKEIEETVIDEKGEEKTVTRTVMAVDPTMHSEYARFFDDGCKGWEKDAELNLYFLKQVQNWANDKLKAQGYLFLNDVYEELGIPKTKAGQIVGWIYDERHPVGDNFVDFGIYNLHDVKARDFVNGYERTILLDFNVDGNILDLMA